MALSISKKAAFASTIAAGVMLILGLCVAMYKFWYDSTHAVVRVGNARFVVEVADSASEREEGLQGVKELDADEGMLFIFASRGEHEFWMKNTLIPLDIIWIDGNEVVHIEESVPPGEEGVPNYKLPTYAPDEPATRALEVRGGSVEQYGVAVGDTVVISD